MRIQIGEYCYFSRTVIAAGTIKRSQGKDMVIRYLQFDQGLLIAENQYIRSFAAMFGNTSYTFCVGRYGNPKIRYTRKPPQKK